MMTSNGLQSVAESLLKLVEVFSASASRLQQLPSLPNGRSLAAWGTVCAKLRSLVGLVLNDLGRWITEHKDKAVHVAESNILMLLLFGVLKHCGAHCLRATPCRPLLSDIILKYLCLSQSSTHSAVRLGMRPLNKVGQPTLAGRRKITQLKGWRLPPLARSWGWWIRQGRHTRSSLHAMPTAAVWPRYARER